MKTVPILVALIIFTSCRTKGPRNLDISGIIKDDKIVMAVPEDLKDIRVSPDLIKEQVKGTSKGFALAQTFDIPVTSDGVEELLVNCFSKGSVLIADWYAYAVISVNGEPIVEQKNEGIGNCREVQVEMKNLDRTKNYQLEFGYFWQSEDSETQIVFYKGTTKAFKPGSQNVALVLRKQITDQVVDIDVEKTEKDLCIFQKYLWTGQECLSEPQAIMFVHADFTDRGVNPGEIEFDNAMCLQTSAGGGRQIPCAGKIDRFSFKIYGARDADGQSDNKIGKYPLQNTDFHWFVIKKEGRSGLCLHASKDSDKDFLNLSTTACKDRTDDKITEPIIPVPNQLFTIVKATSGDLGGRNAFRIMNYNAKANKSYCLAVPETLAKGVSSLQKGAPSKMVPCIDINKTNSSDPDVENLRKSQFIRFMGDGGF